jgi:hypothetical protein
MTARNPLDDPLHGRMFEAGSSESTQHNKLKFFESRLLVEATSAAGRQASGAARKHLHRGFVIRHLMMQTSRVRIRDATLNRRNPLDPFLATELSVYLNGYYLNLRGALDNLAWAATYHYALIDNVDEATSKCRRFCTLESRDFVEALATHRPGIVNLLDEVTSWMDEVKRFRDPAAHRLPLTLVSAILSTDEQEMLIDLRSRAVTALQAGDMNAWGSLKGEEQRVGVFAPILAEPRGPDGELINAPLQIASDQYVFLGFGLRFIDECFGRELTPLALPTAT